MSEDHIDGAANQLKGGVEQAAGKLLGDDKLQAGGQIDEALGKLQDAYGQGVEQLQKTITDVEAYAKANPWIALGAALGAGLVIGHARGRSGRKLVYVRKVKPSEVA